MLFNWDVFFIINFAFQNIHRVEGVPRYLFSVQINLRIGCFFSYKFSLLSILQVCLSSLTFRSEYSSTRMCLPLSIFNSEEHSMLTFPSFFVSLGQFLSACSLALLLTHSMRMLGFFCSIEAQLLCWLLLLLTTSLLLFSKSISCLAILRNWRSLGT